MRNQSGRSAHRVVAAGGRPVGINRAACGRDKGTGLVVAHQLEDQARHVGFFQIDRLGVSGYEFVCRQVQALSEHQDVVGRQHDPDGMAAGGKTTNTSLCLLSLPILLLLACLIYMVYRIMTF